MLSQGSDLVSPQWSFNLRQLEPTEPKSLDLKTLRRQDRWPRAIDASAAQGDR